MGKTKKKLKLIKRNPVEEELITGSHGPKRRTMIHEDRRKKKIKNVRMNQLLNEQDDYLKNILDLENELYD